VKAHDVLEPSSVPVYKHFRGCLHLHVSVLCQDSLCSNGNSMLAGRQFFAHRIALLASSDAFCAMFDSSYRGAANHVDATCVLFTRTGAVVKVPSRHNVLPTRKM
jgi:hypothetical protein